MLISVDTGAKVTKMPHAADFARWRKQISDADYEKVVEAINAEVDANDVNTAGWIPGSDWTGSAYEPLYYACGKNEKQAGLFFGLIVFKVLMERKDYVWGFGRFEKDGVAIRSMTYFITQVDPKTL